MEVLPEKAELLEQDCPSAFDSFHFLSYISSVCHQHTRSIATSPFEIRGLYYLICLPDYVVECETKYYLSARNRIVEYFH